MIGTVLNDRYEITDHIGKGAMGTVYKAADQQTGATVAVKVLAGELHLEPEMVERFRREGEALQQLNHPNIVGYLDTFVHDGQQVIVLEYIPGGSLYDLIKREAPLPIERVQQIALDLCDALIRAHRLDIVHRDLKPENVLLAEDGAPRLTDFGVARLVSEATRLTGTGAQIGTPYYMAPEAWEGEKLDAQADIWSLGVVLYEMLSGEVPFGGETLAAVMNKVLTAPLPDLKSLRAEVPEGLVQIVMRMLTRDKAERYQSVREVAADLERGQPAVVAPTRRRPLFGPRVATTVVAERRRSAPLLGGLALLVVALVVAGIFVAPRLLSPVESGGEGAGTVAAWDFESGEAPGWALDPRGWQVVQVEDGYALEGRAPEEGGVPYMAFPPGGPMFENFHLSFRLKIGFGAAEIGFRQQDREDCYFYELQLAPFEQTIEKYQQACEQPAITLGTDTASLEANTWHQLELSAVGDQLELAIDGQPVMSVDDDAYDAGRIYFGSGYPGAVFYIDDVSLDAIEVEATEVAPTPTPAPVLVAEGALGEVLFEDDFEGDLTRWDWGERDEWEIVPADGGHAARGMGSLWISLENVWNDYTLEADLQMVEPSPKGDYRAGFILRRSECPLGAGGNGNEYRVDFTEWGVELSKLACDGSGEHEVLTGVAGKVESGQWYRVQLSVVGNRIKVAFDGEELIDYLDEANPHLEGYLGLATSEAVTLFDNFRVTEIIPGEAVAEEVISPAATQPAAEDDRCGSGETELLFEDFEDEQAQGWYFQAADGSPTEAWPIEADANGNHALVGNGHAWAEKGSEGWTDYTLRVRLRLLTDETGTQIAVRVGDDGRYSVAYPPGLLFGPESESLAELEPRDMDTMWHTVTFSAIGGRLEVYWDDEPVAAYDDPEPISRGLIGFENSAGTVWYDDVLVCKPAAAAVGELSGLFTDSGQNLGDTNSTALAFGDVDDDGDLDAFVGNHGPNQVWLNDGTGAFSNSGQMLGDSESYAVALGDLDGDGDLDAFVGNFRTDNTIWLNDGAGNFSDSGQRLSGSDGFAAILGDLDGDGDLDAFEGSGGANKVWLNDGTGSFSDSAQSLGGSDSVALALGDLDDDGDLDAFVANWGDGEANKVWLNDGAGTFSDSGQNLGSSGSRAVALGDVDGDADLDAFVGNHGSEANKVWLNDGTGTFGDSGQNLGSSDSGGIALADLDGDGDLDAFVGNGSSVGGQANKVWLNDGTGAFSDSGLSLGNSNSWPVALGDVDGDGDLDAFVGNAGANTVWLNSGRR